MKTIAKILIAASILIFATAFAEEDYLQPGDAFQMQAKMIDAGRLEVRYKIAEGYYLYRDRFAFSAQGAKLGNADIPKGRVKFDQNFNKNVETYRNEIIIVVPVEAQGAFTFKAVSQGCADRGLCYAPMEAEMKLFPNTNSLGTAIESAREKEAVRSIQPIDETKRPALPEAESEASQIEASLSSGRLGAILPLFFLLGLGLSFTPCVLPMVPILSTIIVGEGEKSTRKSGLALSISYSLGMALVYTIFGIAAGLIGEGLSGALQKPWVLTAFALLMSLLSLSMFDLFQLQVPPQLQLLLTQISEKQRAGKLAGVFLMGAISALIVGPCVAAPLAGVLVYLSQTRDVWIGGSALFVMAMGMSVPLLLIGLSAGSLLPRTGKWMGAVKPFFGVLMLAMAIWMVNSLIPAVLIMLGWGVLAIAYGTFLLWPKKWGWAAKSVGVLCVMLGSVQILGAASGGRDALSPLAHWTTTQSQPPEFKRIKTIADVEAIVRDANGRPVMLDFYADWCISCKEMEKFTFTNSEVKAAMSKMILIQADVTANDADDKALLKKFGLFGPPGIIFFDKSGMEVRSAEVIGYQKAERFLQTIQRID